MEQALLQAIGKPAGGFGSGTKPRRATVDEEETLLPLARRLLPGVPAKIGRSAELEEVFSILSAMDPEPEVRGIPGLTTYLGLISLLPWWAVSSLPVVISTAENRGSCLQMTSACFR